MLEWITNLMNSLGYFAVVFLMFLENVFPPIPSELIMPLAGFISTQGKLSLAGVIIAGTIGSVLGALPLYYLGKTIGEEQLKTWANKYGKWLTVTGEDIEKAKGWFNRHGSITVFIARLVPGVRSLIAIPAGIAKMNLGLFLLYSALGAGLWAALLAYLGHLLGSNYNKVEKFLGPASYVVLGAVVVVYVIRFVKQHRKQTQPVA
jgi:membrane protein DedA with SNARE-associated domain